MPAYASQSLKSRVAESSGRGDRVADTARAVSDTGDDLRRVHAADADRVPTPDSTSAHSGYRRALAADAARVRLRGSALLNWHRLESACSGATGTRVRGILVASPPDSGCRDSRALRRNAGR